MIQRTLLVDDEPLALKLLKNRLKDIPTIEIVGETTKGSEVLHLIKELNPHLIFLDINLGTYSGLDLAEQIYILYPHVQVVFVTAYSDYAIQAFELNAIDYLLKPVSSARLTKTISRLQPMQPPTHPISAKVQPTEMREQPKIFLKVFGQAQFLDDGLQPIKVRTKKVEELFYFLWHMQDKPPTRDAILFALWEELPEEKAAALMHSTFYQLRKTLQQLNFKNPITLQNKVYSLNLEVSTDYDEWIMIVKRNDTNEHSVLRALDLYRGDYFSVQSFDWAATEREQLRALWLNYLLKIVQTQVVSVTTLERILIHVEAIEAFQEDWIVETIHFLGKNGKFHDLYNYYSKIQHKWREDLGIALPQAITSIYSYYLMKNV